MSKTATIAKFANAYTGFEFKAQMYALSTLAKSLGLIMFFEDAQNGSTKYEFFTSKCGLHGHKLSSITLKNDR